MAQQFRIEELVSEAGREIMMRQRVFPRWVKDGRMSQEDCDRKIMMMHAIQDKLRDLKADEGLFPLRNQERDIEDAENYLKVKPFLHELVRIVTADDADDAKQQLWEAAREFVVGNPTLVGGTS